MISPCSLHRRAEVWWPADTSDGNAVETASRVLFDLSYTYNTHENRFTKPLKITFLRKNIFSTNYLFIQKLFVSLQTELFNCYGL